MGVRDTNNTITYAHLVLRRLRQAIRWPPPIDSAVRPTPDREPTAAGDGAGSESDRQQATAELGDHDAALLAAGDHRLVMDDGVRVVARVRTDASPVDVRAGNRTAVTDLLDELSVPYFFVPGFSHVRAVVGVRDRHRSAILERVRVAWRGEAVYVRPAEKGASPTLSDSGEWPSGLREAPAIAVFSPVTDPGGTLVLGTAFACEIEFWSADPERPGMMIAPRRNRVAEQLPDDMPSTAGSEHLFTGMLTPASASPVPTLRPFASARVDDVTFPIDAVYTWVEDSDPEWQQRQREALTTCTRREEVNTLATNVSRFANRDELLFSLRSLHQYAPWIRHIFLVTDDQLPYWLDTSSPHVTVVRHQTIFGEVGVLPTFNSHAIESRLHHIPGLSEHFLYLNDDVFFARPSTPLRFFHGNGLSKFFTSKLHVDLGDASVADRPVMSAAKNNRDLIEQTHGRTVTQKLQHVPHPQRLSVLQELEDRFPGEFKATASHQFRHPDDISVPSALQHYWSYLTGRAVRGKLRYSYADLSNPATPATLDKLLTGRDHDVFCLNDDDSDEAAIEEQGRMVSEFLTRYFPMRSPLELPDDVSRERAERGASALWRESTEPAGERADRRP